MSNSESELFANLPDKYHGEGGTFEVREGERVLVTPPTQPHPDGDRARYADGTPVDAPQTSAPAPGPVVHKYSEEGN